MSSVSVFPAMSVDYSMVIVIVKSDTLVVIMDYDHVCVFTC